MRDEGSRQQEGMGTFQLSTIVKMEQKSHSSVLEKKK